MEFESFNYIPIVNFYAYNYLGALSNDKYHLELSRTYAIQALSLFSEALNWELKKSFELCKPNGLLLDRESILDWIDAYPPELHEKTKFLGEKWKNIALTIYSEKSPEVKVDLLVDMDHNFGNVLSRILINYRKYAEFLTVKAHCERIIESILFIDDSKIKRDI